MASCHQPDSCLVGSPLALISLSLSVIPAAGAFSFPNPTLSQGSTHVPASQAHPCPGGHQGWEVAQGWADGPSATWPLFLQLEPTATAALASAGRPSSPCLWCWWASVPAASSPLSLWWLVSFEPRGVRAPGPGRVGEGCRAMLPALGPRQGPLFPGWDASRGLGLAFPDCGLGRGVGGTSRLLESSPVLGFTPAFVSPVKHVMKPWTTGE